MPEPEREPVVEVAYGTADRQRVVELAWSATLTARDAVDRSGLLTEFPEIDSASLVLGLFGARIPQSRLLEPGDRVEICRPLTQDPRDMRRAALSEGGVMGQRKS